MSRNNTVNTRMENLDYLRGFFIVIIIIDHLWRWPSLWGLITGEGRLWVSAAEGFVIISGLLVGYIRGYKNQNQRMTSITKKLIHRALLLYVWFVGMSILYTVFLWNVTLIGPVPWEKIGKNQWNDLLLPTITFEYAHIWVHFLYMYAIFLALTPIAVWLLRRGASSLIVLLVTFGFIVGKLNAIEWMQWLPIFFLPAIAGFFLPSIQRKWSSFNKRRRHKLLTILYTFTAITLISSITTTFIIPDHPISIILNDMFSKDTTIHVSRILLSFIWFTALVCIFNQFLPTLKRWLSWLLLPLGTSSLSAYILHGLVIIVIGLLFEVSTNIVINTFLGGVSILMVNVLLRIPLIKKIIPR